jgi:N-methylhydantoinase B
VATRVGEIVMLAMSALTPERVMAASHATAGVTIFGGMDYRTERSYVTYEVTRGGFGARPVKDGINAVGSMTGNMMNTPVEVMEMDFPLLIEEYSIIPDSGGAGRWRGGCASQRRWRVLGSESNVSVCFERGVTPAPGLEGGHSGSPTAIYVISADGVKRQINTKGTLVLEAGGKLHAELPGGGGYGDPRERDRRAVVADVLDGYVSKRAAKEIYGVDLDRTPSA